MPRQPVKPSTKPTQRDRQSSRPRKKPKAGKVSVTAARARLPVSSTLADIRRMIESTRLQTAQAVNAALTALYWQIGTRIRQDILKEARGVRC